jgi:hypothetical protein
VSGWTELGIGTACPPLTTAPGSWVTTEAGGSASSHPCRAMEHVASVAILRQLERVLRDGSAAANPPIAAGSWVACSFIVLRHRGPRMSNNPFIDSEWRNMSGACAFQAAEVCRSCSQGWFSYAVPSHLLRSSSSTALVCWHAKSSKGGIHRVRQNQLRR